MHISSRITRSSVPNLLLRHEAHPERAKLTPRQREVLQLIAEGYTMKEAASILKLTKRTVAYHKYTIMGITGLEDEFGIGAVRDPEFHDPTVVTEGTRFRSDADKL